MRSNRYHMGTGFEVWTAQESWFWFVDNPHRDAGTIGAAATEAEAIRQACMLIEDLSVAICETRAHPRWASVPVSVIEWDQRLANLERYLAGARAAAA